MLTLTDNATAIVNEITTQPGLSEDAGLRITSAPTPEPSFEVTAAAQGEPGDQVVEQGGATVYLDESAAAAPGRQGARRRGRPGRQGRVRARPPGLSPPDAPPPTGPGHGTGARRPVRTPLLEGSTP